MKFEVMSNTSDYSTDEFPVLKDVVSPGDESVIKSNRLGHEVIREIEKLEQQSTNGLSPAQINRDITQQQINQLIEEIVDRHLTDLQAELKQSLSKLLLRN